MTTPVRSRTERMDAIRDEVVGLVESPLYAERVSQMYYPVIGEGNHEASILFVGEAPGRNEALTGRPFCGASGKILDQLLAHIGVDRDTVYITNIVKDRPPGNRDPEPAEIALYGPFLDRQIDIIQPRVIATLGRISMAYIFDRFKIGDRLSAISQMHGRPVQAHASYGTVHLVPLYHPAFGIYNRTKMPELLADMEILKTYASL